MHKSVQKGLQPRLVIRQVDVQDDAFPAFLEWLRSEKDYSAKVIIQVVAEPYKFKKEWEEYHEQTE